MGHPRQHPGGRRAVGIPKIGTSTRATTRAPLYFQVNQKRGRRWSAARGFLKPVLNRPNLCLETGVHVERVVLDGRRATGVSYVKAGERHVAHAASEVILTAGAVASPKILELSGIGDGTRCRRLGIPVAHHLPGVGENLQDHLQLRPIYKVAGVRTLNDDYAGSGAGRRWASITSSCARGR